MHRKERSIVMGLTAVNERKRQTRTCKRDYKVESIAYSYYRDQETR